MILYEDLLETILVNLFGSKSLFSFISVFSRVTTKCYCDAAFGETRGHGAVLQESHGRSGTLAHHQKQGQVSKNTGLQCARNAYSSKTFRTRCEGML